MATISGHVYDSSGNPAVAAVDVYRYDTGEHVARVYSDASTGAYSVATADAQPHIVVRHVAPSIVGDALWDNVIVGSHFEGSAGSSTFTNAKAGLTISGANSPVLSSAQAKFGTTSVTFPASAYLYINSTPALADFTISFFLYLTAYGGFVLRANAGGDYLNTYFSGSNFIFMAGGITVNAATHIPLNAWNHFELCRSGSTVYAFINGGLVGTCTSSASSSCQLELFGAHDTSSITGYADELLILTACRHMSAFTPPTAPFFENTPSLGAPTENAQVFDYVIPV